MSTTVDARETALLVMDVQPMVLGLVADGDGFIATVSSAIAAVRAAGGQVGYVRVAFEDADLAAIPATNKTFAALAGRTGMDANGPAAAVEPRIAPEAGDIVVRKVRVGAFSTTDLDAQLRARGITTLILAGISTSGVVLSTLRDAADRDYRLFVLSDATGDPDPEVHRVLIEKVFPFQADVLTVAELGDLLEKTG